MVAASVLRASGFDDVSDVLGGFAAWQAAGLPASCGAEADIVDHTPQIGARAAKAMVDGGALLLDVREPDEWCIEHAPTAMLLPVGRVLAQQDELPRDRRIVVMCRSGGRSAAVAASLRRSGFDAVNLAGGICAWAAAGLPVVSHGGDPGLVVHREDPLNCETSLPALIGGAEKMPEENYSFKPTPEVRSFGQLVGHAANAQYLFCSVAAGEKNPSTANIEETKTSKADLVQALKDGVSYCSKVYAAMTDAQASQIVKFFGRDMAKLTVLSFNSAHSDEHYGNIVTYLRLKGIVPPTSEPKK